MDSTQNQVKKMAKQSIDKSRSRYGDYVTLRFHKPVKLYHLTWNSSKKIPAVIAIFPETDGDYAIRLWEELEKLCFENNELKCALALSNVDYLIADGKKIDIPPYYEFEQRYASVMHRREYDGYD